MKRVKTDDSGGARAEAERPVTWSLRIRTYVPVTSAAPAGPGPRDEDIDATSDDGGPTHS